MVLLTAAYLPPRFVIGSPLVSSAGGGVVFPPPTCREARDAGPRVYIPSHDAVCSLQHAVDVHKPSVEARN